jgi:thiamine pyrophosphate-dependent acetolactate synthase large subunit-like protein
MLDARQVRRKGFRTPETRAMLQSAPHVFAKPTDGLDPRLLASNLGRALPRGGLVTCGLGHFFSFPAIYLALPEGAEIQFASQFGAVGQGLPLAIGIGVGNPGRPHVAIEGDGSLMMNIQELDTVVRHKLQMVLVVWNDAGYGAEAHKLRAKGFDSSLAQWESPDFAARPRVWWRRRAVAVQPSLSGRWRKVSRQAVCS